MSRIVRSTSVPTACDIFLRTAWRTEHALLQMRSVFSNLYLSIFEDFNSAADLDVNRGEAGNGRRQNRADSQLHQRVTIVATSDYVVHVCPNDIVSAGPEQRYIIDFRINRRYFWTTLWVPEGSYEHHYIERKPDFREPQRQSNNPQSR